MDSTNKLIQHKDFVENGIISLLDDLHKIILLERESAIKSNGPTLDSLTNKKNRLLFKLVEALKTGYSPTEEINNRLQQVNIENQVNLKLFRSILKLINGYKNIIKDIPLDSGTYSSKGVIEKQPISICLNRSA
jgi:hypothetical protein